jgi:hypothetical protein
MAFFMFDTEGSLFEKRNYFCPFEKDKELKNKRFKSVIV